MPSRRAALVAAAHLATVVLFFRDLLFDGAVPYFRDLASHYYPSFVLLERAQAAGVAWPLWNQYSNAGEPFLDPYWIDLLSVRLVGALWALRLDAPLHVWIAACGISALALALGTRAAGAWAAGAAFAFGGYVLSCANSLQLFHGVCWAPFVLASGAAVLRNPDAPRIALLGFALGTQVGTMAGDVVLQTALAGALIFARWPDGPRRRALVAGAVLAALLAAPALLGTRAVLAGTRRGAGFSAAEVLDFSAGPMVLLESLVPHLFGDVHTFSDVGFWGQAYFPKGYPYLVSLYVGPGVLLLAAAGRFDAAARRLLALALLGVLLSLGSHGPFAWVLPRLMLGVFRFPVKFFFLSTLAVALLAGRGVDRLDETPLRTPLRLLPAALLIALALATLARPSWPASLLGGIAPALADARARWVAAVLWPSTFLRTGLLCLAAGLAAGVASPLLRRAALAAVLADLLIVNAVCHPTTDAAFYDPRPGLKSAVGALAPQGTWRWFSFGLANTPGLEFQPEIALRNSDVWLYWADRQGLWGNAHILDGLESAWQEEQSFAPEGATLSVSERQPSRFGEYAGRLRLANVRWVLSFVSLPPELVTRVGVIPMPELRAPLQVFELHDPVPRAFWVPRVEVVEDASAYAARTRTVDFDPRTVALARTPPAPAPAAPAPPPSEGNATVSWEQPDPQTVRVRASTPPGFIVVVEGHDPGWRLSDESGPVALTRADGRYWLFATPGGTHVFEARFEPAWRVPALALAALGIAVGVLLLGARVRSGGDPA